MQYTSADVLRGPIRENPDKIWFQVYSDVEFVQNFTPPDLQAKNLHRQFHLILTVLVRKNTKNEWKWRNLNRWQKFYTAAGTDGMDKFHLWTLCT